MERDKEGGEVRKTKKKKKRFAYKNLTNSKKVNQLKVAPAIEKDFNSQKESAANILSDQVYSKEELFLKFLKYKKDQLEPNTRSKWFN